MAVNHRTPQLPADQVELVAELGHLIGGVFVAGQHLVDGVQDHRDVAPVFGPADQFGGQLVHGHRSPPQVPQVDPVHMVGGKAQGLVDVGKPVEAGRPVQFQVDIQHPSRGAGPPAQPLGPLGDADGQLDQGKALARLAGAGQQHLVALPQHPFDQGRGQLGQMSPAGRQGLGVGQIIGLALHPGLPGFKGRLPQVDPQQVLLAAAPGDARHPGQPRRVLVLGVGFQTVLPADLVEVLHPAAVLAIVGGVHPDDGVDALAAGIHHGRTGELEGFHQGFLFGQGHRVRFHQGEAVLGDVIVLAALAVQGVEPYPGPGGGLPVSQHLAQVPTAFGKLLNQLPGGAAPAAPAGQPFSVLLPALGDVAHILGGLKQGL